MKEVLILLTSRFPYGNGETFLEVEINYLSTSFDQIIILPIKKASVLTYREVPKNCTVDFSIISKKNKESSFRRYLSKIISSFTLNIFYKELFYLIARKFKVQNLARLLTYTRDIKLAKESINSILSTCLSENNRPTIYTYWCNAGTTGCLLNKYHLPVSTRIHGGDLYEELYPKNYIPFRKFSFEKLNRVFPISRYGIEYLSKKKILDHKKLVLSPLGIKIPNIKKTRDNPSDTFNIVSCSAINSNKRIIEIGKSLKSFALDNPDIILHWNHFGDGPLFSRLKNLSKTFPKNLTTTFFGQVSNNELLDWYSSNRASLFINFSRSEGIPVSIMEASSYAIPSIATDVGGSSEIVNTDTGWLINSELSKAEIFNALKEAIQEPVIRKRKAKSARKLCAMKFNSDINYPNFIQRLKA